LCRKSPGHQVTLPAQLADALDPRRSEPATNGGDIGKVECRRLNEASNDKSFNKPAGS
jgi:hypothetical protein